jgi:Protein kinase domain
MPEIDNSNSPFGDFIIEDQIGEGGMGQVYKAWQKSLDRVVAIKILSEEYAKTAEYVGRFRREARAAASLVHPNVVQIYAVGEARGVPFFAMEYIKGKSLEDELIDNRKFTYSEVAAIAIGVSKALEAAFEKNLVHRDIKPGNIMFDARGNIKVTDFGLAKPGCGSLNVTQPGLVIGTPTYMSPEQACGEKVGPGSDIYSLGIVMYELLTGATPFESKQIETVIYKHVHAQPVSPSKIDPAVPDRLEEIVLRCLTKTPEERYASPTELLNALKSFLRGEKATRSTRIVAAGQRQPTLTPAPVAGPVAVSASDPAVDISPKIKKPKLATAMTVALSPDYQGGEVKPTGSARMFALVSLLLLCIAGGGGYYYWCEVLRRPLPFFEPGGYGYTEPDQNQRNGRKPRRPVQPDGGQVNVDGSGKPGPTSGNDGDNLALLSLKPLEELFPRGSSVKLLWDGGSEEIDLQDPPELRLAPGKYSLSFSRSGYQNASWNFQLSAAGAQPQLDGELIKVAAAESITVPYNLAGKLLKQATAHGAEKALLCLKQVAALDAQYGKLEEMRSSAREILESCEEKWKLELLGAEKLTVAGKLAEAKKVYARVSKETPIDHALHESALRGFDRVGEKLTRLAGLQAELTTLLESGNYDRARTLGRQYQGLAGKSQQLAALMAGLKKGTALLNRANADYAESSFKSAAEGFAAVLKISPQCQAARTLRVKCLQLLTEKSEVLRVLVAAEGQYEAGDFKACLKNLDRLAHKDLGKSAGRSAALRAKAETGLEKSILIKQLADFDSAFLAANSAKLKKDILDFKPQSEKFRQQLFAARGALSSSGIKVSVWSGQLESCKFVRSGKGDFEMATASVKLSYDLSLPELSRSIKGQVPVRLSFRKSGRQWLITGAQAGGRSQVKAGGEGPAQAAINAAVSGLEKGLLTLDRGSNSGVKKGMVFNLFEQARVVHLPLTGEKLFVEERLLARVEVVTVSAKTATCAFLPGTTAEVISRVKVGMLAALNIKARVNRSFPVVVGIKAGRTSLAAGESVLISLDVKALPGVLTTCRWEASGGRLSEMRSSKPQVFWTAPGRKGQYEISVKLISASGRSQLHRIKLTSSGKAKNSPKVYKKEARFGLPDLLETAIDAAFDKNGVLYVLDSRKKRVLFFSARYEHLGSSGRYESGLVFSRIALREGKIYCLDSKACKVSSYLVGQTIEFKKAVGPSIGQRGSGNGRLSSPVDMAFSPSGELHILDGVEDSPSVQVFEVSGKFIMSYGSAGRGGGRLEKPVAITFDAQGNSHVLDAARRKIISFKEGRPLGSFACGAKKSDLRDLSFDPASGSLLVLDASGGLVAAYSSVGKLLSPTRLGAKSGLATLKGYNRLTGSRAGGLIAIDGSGKRLCRFDSGGTFAGQIGGAPLAYSCKIAAAPREKVAALDTSSGQVTVFDGNGWMLSRFGGKTVIRKGIDIACDGKGLIYVLDASSSNVKVFDMLGRPQGTYGRSGKPPAGLDDVIDLAVAGDRSVGVLCYRAENSVFLYGIGKKGGPVCFPQERKSTAGVRRLAVDEQGRSFVLTKKGQLSLWGANQAKTGTWSRTFKSVEDMQACAGRLFLLEVRSRQVVVCDPGGTEVTLLKLPRSCSKPLDLAVSDHEVIYVFDSSSRSLFKFRGH